MEISWLNEFDSAVTICDVNGKIIFINDKAARMFSNDGGKNLLGSSLFDCHSEQSNEIIRKLIRENKSNTYTIEKNGIKKLIHQSPWQINGEVMGLIEFSIEIPFEMPHHIRS